MDISYPVHGHTVTTSLGFYKRFFEPIGVNSLTALSDLLSARVFCLELDFLRERGSSDPLLAFALSLPWGLELSFFGSFGRGFSISSLEVEPRPSCLDIPLSFW